MSWFDLGKTAMNAFGNASGGGDALPGVASSGDSTAPVTVSVGGLNVPAYPDFPRMTNTVTGQTQGQAIDYRLYYLAGAVVVAALIVKVAK